MAGCFHHLSARSPNLTIFFVTVSGRLLNDLYELDPTGAIPRWTLLAADSDAPPPPPARHSAGFVAAGGQLFLFGGNAGPAGISCCPACHPTFGFNRNFAELHFSTTILVFAPCPRVV